MSYVLFLGFKCTVYKKPPMVRASLNGIFLDEFSVVPNSLCDMNNYSLLSDELEKRSMHGRSTPVNNFLNREKFLPNHNNWLNKDIILKIIELEEVETKEKHSVELEIFNTDNNYTNGFMTKSTMISLYLTQIIPKKVLNDPNLFYKNFIMERMKIKKNQLDIDSVKKMYKNKQRMFDLIDYNLIKNLQDRRFKLPYYNKTTKKAEQTNYGQWIGSQGVFNLSIPADLIKSTVDVTTTEVDDIQLNCLTNKYKQYAN